MENKLAPSILSADFSRLGEDVRSLDRFGADYVHIDVMDGSFVPNISFGLPVVKSIRGCTDRVFDVHLMIENPQNYINAFADAGADIITIHQEAERHLDRAVNLIHECGKKACVALNPATPICLISELIPMLDMVLLMTVNPGFGGQKFIPYTLKKIRELRSLADRLNPELDIEVDGGITADNVSEVLSAGANVIVAGSAVFSGDIEKNIKAFKEKF